MYTVFFKHVFFLLISISFQGYGYGKQLGRKSAIHSFSKEKSHLILRINTCFLLRKYLDSISSPDTNPANEYYLQTKLMCIRSSGRIVTVINASYL